MLNWVYEPGRQQQQQKEKTCADDNADATGTEGKKELGPAPATFGELASSAREVWDQYYEARPDPTEPWGRWRAHAARALEHLRSEAVADVPLRFVCETQLILRVYLEGRKKMHLLYKASCLHARARGRKVDSRLFVS